MNTDAPTPVEDHKEKKNPLFEVVNKEKLWWALMHSKGLLNTDVQDLYRKARNCYEKIILNDYEVVELQEVEYCLWKLHYKYIDEFRKRIRPTSSNATNLQNSIDIHTEGFKSFLYEATEFYKDLIIKTRRWYKKDDGSDSVEPSKLHGYQYVHHRFLVCLGDLARYRELCKKTDLENRDWSIASNYYFEATKVCPDSGNPQNQLALLATYVGEDFLALYHCVRSLAVKEPFPDAWDNLMLLFEKNRASHLPSLSVKDCFDFSNPSQRMCSSAEPHERKVDLWPLFVRTISFFFIQSSLEDFTFTFASTMKELESLLALDDIKLQASLESYEQMDSARKGPYRALQLVSTFIFILHKLTKNPEPNDPKEKYELALNATFICMGRIIERCNWPDSCHLLAAILVFIEWLVSVLDKVETCSVDEKIDRSISYFFGAFVDLLNRLDTKDGEVANNALWEDYELRGFVPIFQENISVVFRTNMGSSQNYDSDNGSRVHRLFLAAMKIVEKSRKWICCDKSRKKFYTAEMRKIEDKRVGEAKEQEHENGNEESESENQVQSFVKGESVSIEEEEEILFRPITRYNSAPIYNDEMCGRDSPTDKSPPSDECLRRALSLYDPQNKTQPGSNKPVKLPDQATIPPAGPPSLSAWVINRENLNNIGRTTRDFTKHELTPIEEIDSLIGSTHISEPTQDSSPYIAPLPSAPFLPEDAVWFKGNSPYFPQKNSALGIKEADGILGPPPPPPNWSANLGLLDRSTPFSGMSSSEWLYNYQNSKNFERTGNHVWPVRGNYDSRDAFDRWQSSMVSDPDPTVYMEGPQLYLGPGQINGVGYPMPSLYGCGAGTDFRGEQPQLLQYLKEREWQLQREAQLRGPHYMGN